MKENSKINAGWHKLHPMPENATIDQRIEWHLQHLQHCQCRTDLPEKLKEENKNNQQEMEGTKIALRFHI